MAKYRLFLVFLLILWVGFVFSAFYVVQKPLAMQVGAGLFSIFKTLLLTGTLLLESACLGGKLLRRFFPDIDNGGRIFLGTGLGLGLFGLLGFGLAALGAAHPLVLLAILAGLALLGFLRGWLRQSKEDAAALWQALQEPLERGDRWIPWLAGIAGLLPFLLALAPPADSFDALLYHLTIPAAWLKDGGLAASQINPHYWFPTLVEGVFVWGLAFESETAAPLLHLAWGILAVGLVWWWTRKVWSNSLAWRCVAVLISMPSLPLLASWAYTDLALAYYSVAVLYTLWLARDPDEKRLWSLGGIFCGFAMGVKYTSFLLPLVGIGWMVWNQRHKLAGIFMNGIRFAVPAILAALPWYLRNWIWVGNPFYPFVFGGKTWDAFLAGHYGEAGTGIGFNLSRLFLLPLNVTLGQYDANYFDGRIGPLWLILLPAAVWAIWHFRRQPGREALYLQVLFGAVSLGTWTFGVMQTSALWQSRLLFPALFALAPLAALAWEALGRLDMPRFRFSFVFNLLAVLSITASLLDFSLFVISHDPLSAALGLTSRQTYMERFQGPYADALSMVSQTPPDSRIYFLFEPRSYGMERPVTPDAINQNLNHDLHLYHTPEAALRAWQAEGYTFVLYQRAGDDFVEEPAKAAQLFSLLSVESETVNTILYRVPSP
jgi:hypothetical protein